MAASISVQMEAFPALFSPSLRLRSTATWHMLSALRAGAASRRTKPVDTLGQGSRGGCGRRQIPGGPVQPADPRFSWTEQAFVSCVDTQKGQWSFTSVSAMTPLDGKTTTLKALILENAKINYQGHMHSSSLEFARDTEKEKPEKKATPIISLNMTRVFRKLCYSCSRWNRYISGGNFSVAKL